MATSKTLTPTNVTIQIPEFTDQPDQRVNSNCLDKEADAINALDTDIAKINNVQTYSGTVDAIQTAMVTRSANLEIGVPEHIFVTPSAASGVFDATNYVGEMTKINNTRFNVQLSRGATAVEIVGAYNNGVWTWQQLAPKNETVATYSTSGNTEANVAKIWKVYDASLGYCLVVETRDGVQKKIKMDA